MEHLSWLDDGGDGITRDQDHGGHCSAGPV